MKNMYNLHNQMLWGKLQNYKYIVGSYAYKTTLYDQKLYNK